MGSILLCLEIWMVKKSMMVMVMIRRRMGRDYIRERQGRCLDIWVVTLAKSRPVEREVEKQIGIRCAPKKSQAKKTMCAPSLLHLISSMWL